MESIRNILTRRLVRSYEDRIPHSVIALGYSKDVEDFSEKVNYDADCVHFEMW